jgi:hypothetical protein
MPKVSFDKKRWQKIVQRPDWYLEYINLANEAKKILGEETAEFKELNKEVRHFFEDELKRGSVAIATSGPDWDEERQPIDTVVIHHTSAKPGYRLSYMNGVQLLNIYADHYAKPTDDKQIKGEPIWSGHFNDNQQVFYAYHWLMRMDGGFERLLDDDQIGWHAGNWDINKRSIGICLDNDYENHDPSDEILHKLSDFINEKYPDTKIIGHREARTGTICPGTNFPDGWKKNLLSYLS